MREKEKEREREREREKREKKKERAPYIIEDITFEALHLSFSKLFYGTKASPTVLFRINLTHSPIHDTPDLPTGTGLELAMD